MAAHPDNHLQMEWHAERMLESQQAVMESHISTPNTKDERTSEWVMASQKMLDELLMKSLSVKVTLKYVISGRVTQKLSKECQPMPPNLFF